MESRWYLGELVTPCGVNSSGMRWSCLIDGKGIYKADTLAGIKALIRDAKGLPTAYDFQGLYVGDRVKIAPHTDLFMRGVRYATIRKIGRKWLTIDNNGTFKVSPFNVDLCD